MPIKAPHRHAHHGNSTPLGIKVLGSDLARFQQVGEQIETALKEFLEPPSVFAERTSAGISLISD